MSSDRLLDILGYIASQHSATSPVTIANHLNIPLSSVYRYLMLLKNKRFIAEGKNKGWFTIAAVGLQMAQNYMSNSYLLDIAKPELIRISTKTKETVALMVPSHSQAICVELVESQHALRCSFVVGKGTPLSQGASAKTLLAFMDLDDSTELIEHLSLNTEQIKSLHDELHSIRRQGYGVSLGEVDEGIWGVSVPLKHKKQLLGVVTTMCPATRIDGRENHLTTATTECAHAIIEHIVLQ